MIEARDALEILQKQNRNNPTWINRDLYRLLYNPTLHIMAYERLKSKPGNMTPLMAINRKQIPVCKQCHRDIHAGRYDGENLASILDKLEATRPVAQGPSH